MSAQTDRDRKAPRCRHGHTGPHRYSVPVFEVGDDSEAWCSGPPTRSLNHGESTALPPSASQQVDHRALIAEARELAKSWLEGANPKALIGEEILADVTLKLADALEEVSVLRKDRETLIGLAIVAADKAEAKMRAIDYRLLGSPAARTYREHAAVDAVLAALRERGMG